MERTRGNDGRPSEPATEEVHAGDAKEEKVGGKVEIVVNYQSGQRKEAFRRNTTVDDLLIWAIGVFGIDPAMAAEFELARAGQKEELSGSEHVGHLASHGQHIVELDLVRGDIANGSIG